MVTSPITLSLEGLNCKNKKSDDGTIIKKIFQKFAEFYIVLEKTIFFTETGENIVTELVLFDFLFFN